ncbi:MAG: LysR family transcriptional regulator [Eubacteriales bacterium]|jgi:DNA-binding transcriptional LysR family regulator
MNLRHLRIFIAVVECGSMHKAASQLYISQPSISQAIAELEAHYGVRLFDRLSQKLYLTPQGQTLLPKARQVLDAFDNLDLSMKDTAQQQQPRIGGTISVGIFLLGQLLDRLNAQMPGLQPIVSVYNTATIEEMLRSNQLDMAVVEGIINGCDMIQTPFFQDELVLFVGPGHPLFHQKQISLRDLNGLAFISREPESNERNRYEQLLARHHIQLQQVWTSTNTEVIKNAVLKGRGLGLLSHYVIRQEVEQGKLRILPVEGMRLLRDIRLVYHKDKFLSPALEAFVHVCTTFHRQ